MKLNQENYELKTALTKNEQKSKEIVDTKVQQLESQLKFEVSVCVCVCDITFIVCEF